VNRPGASRLFDLLLREMIAPPPVRPAPGPVFAYRGDPDRKRKRKAQRAARRQNRRRG